MLLAVSTGHLGPTVFVSKDLGNTWLEAGVTQDHTLQAMLMFNF